MFEVVSIDTVKSISNITVQVNIENELYDKGIELIGGVDEVGRGPLIGSVVAACVVLPKGFVLEGLTDSKKLSEKADEVYTELSKHFMCYYDEAGSIGKRYRREDEIGTPYCVTIDFDTLEDGCVTVRDRDTMEQIRIKIEDVKSYIEEKLVF